MTVAESSHVEAAKAGASSPPKTTNDASDIYDRQIRLWGAEAQAKMSQAKVLYIHVTAATSEVMKNLVLAGIPAALFDPRPHPVSSAISFFLACSPKDGEPAAKKTKQTVAQAVQSAVQDLNPLLGDCPVLDEAASVDDLLSNHAETLASYSVVVASRLTPSQATQMAQIVTKAGNKFFMLDTFGMDGACVMDLGANHTFRPEKGKDLLDPTSLSVHVPLRQIFATPLHEAVNRFHKTFPPVVWVHYRLLLEYAEQTKAWSSIEAVADSDFVDVVTKWCRETGVPENLFADQACLRKETLQSLYRVASAELAPVASVLGGLVGNEIIKALSSKGTPANNTLLLDGSSGKAWTFLVQPKNK